MKPFTLDDLVSTIRKDCLKAIRDGDNEVKLDPEDILVILENLKPVQP